MLFIGILLTIIFGFSVTLIFNLKFIFWERLGMSFLLGIGLLTFLMFLVSWFGLTLTLINIGTILVVITALLFFLYRQKLFESIRAEIIFSSFKNFSNLEKLSLFIILFLILYSFINNLYWPITSWDSITQYDFRGKIFAQTGSIKSLSSYYYNYPLITSLAHTWVYLLGGKNPNFLYTLYYSSFLAVFYFSLKRLKVPRIVCLIFTLMLASHGAYFFHSMVSYTNLPYAIYLVVGTIFLFFWTNDGNRSSLILSSLMIGLALWTRAKEPFWLVPLFTVIIFSIKKKRLKDLLIFSFFLFVLRQPWEIFRQSIIDEAPLVSSLAVNSISMFEKINLNLIGEIIVFVSKYIIGSWAPTFYLFLAVVIFNFKTVFRDKNVNLLFIIFSYLSFLFLGTFIYVLWTPLEWREIPDSAVRMSIFFIPIFLFYLAMSKNIRDIFVTPTKK